MKSVKLYFSLLLSAVMLVVAAPVMAQDETAVVDEQNIEQTTEVAQPEAEAVMLIAEDAEVETAHAPVSTQGRSNDDIDEGFSVSKAIGDFAGQSAIAAFFKEGGWKYALMLIISFVLLYLAIVKKFEPLLLMPIAFGMLLTNLPGAGLFHSELFAGGHVTGRTLLLAQA